jgi:hypothetical protein
MSETDFKIDPTAFGLFLVAVVSLPLAILQFKNEGVPSSYFFIIMGLLILLTSYIAYRNGSNFGFIVFGLVGAAVSLTGLGMGEWENIAFGIVFVMALIWSVSIKTPKTLSCICLTTALIFLSVGLSAVIGGDYWNLILGVVALLNFVFTAYLACALVSDGKIPAI